MTLRLELRTFIRYSAVGIINTAIGYAVILGGMAFGLSPVAANVLGYACGLIVSFAMNSRWTFGGRRKNPVASLGFLIAFAVAYSVNLMALSIALAAQWPPAAAQAVAVVCYQIVFFLLLRFVVFRGEADALMRSARVEALSAADIRRLPLHAALLCAAVAPFLFGQAAAGLVDLPNAIGRIGIGLRLLDNPASSAFYTQSFKLFPNMAVDLWGLFVGRLVGAEAAVNLFVAMSIVIFYVAVQSLRVVLHGRSSAVVGALSIFAIYGIALRYGFVNFIFASGLMIWAVARLEKELRSSSPWYPALQTVLLMTIYLSSIFPALLYIVYAAFRLLPLASQLVARRDWRGFIRLALTHGVGVAAIAALFLFGDAAPPWHQGTGEWNYKFEAVATLLRFHDEPFELTLAAVTLFAGAALAWACRIRLSASQAIPLLALIAVFALMPFSLKGVAFADTRLPSAIAGLLLGSVQFRPIRPRFSRAAMTAAAALMLAAFLKPAAVFLQIRPVLDAGRSLPGLFAETPEGSRLAIIGDAGSNIGGLNVSHLPLIQLTRGDYFFREVFPNYFIDFRPNPPYPEGQRDPSGLNLCAGLTHIVIIGETDWLTAMPIHILRREGSLTMARIRQGAQSDGEPSC